LTEMFQVAYVNTVIGLGDPANEPTYAPFGTTMPFVSAFNSNSAGAPGDPMQGGYYWVDFTGGFEVFAPNSILPVLFGDFITKEQNGKTLLQWSTLTEINNNRFEIERSQNGREWKKIG